MIKIAINFRDSPAVRGEYARSDHSISAAFATEVRIAENCDEQVTWLRFTFFDNFSVARVTYQRKHERTTIES